MEIVDLREQYSKVLFDRFVELYRQVLPAGDLREDPAAWSSRLTHSQDECGFLTHILVGKYDDEVFGGLVCEYYPESSVGLIAYAVVAEHRRGCGVGRALVDAAISRLQHAAHANNRRPLNAIFGETQAPGTGPADELRTRLNVLQRMGFRWLRFPFVAPRLSSDQGRANNLLAMIYTGGRLVSEFSGAVVFEFMREYYAITEGPEGAREAGSLYGNLRNGTVNVSELPTLVEPALAMDEFAIAFHVVVDDADEIGSCPCPVLGSFEADLLSHRFQEYPPVQSHCVTNAPIGVTASLPASLEYVSEGRSQPLYFDVTERDCEVLLSYSDYPRTGLRIWHLVLRPAPDEVFSEYDVVRLLRICHSRIEQVDLSQRVTFQREGSTEAQSFAVLFQRLTEHAHAVLPTATTLEVVPRPLPSPWQRWEALAQTLARARAGEQQALEQLEGVMATHEDRRRLCSLVAIASGIFDFPRMDTMELLDALEPSIENASGLRFHREEFLQFSDENSVTAAVKLSVGISPYLIIPHAALIHNESMLVRAEEFLKQSTHGMSTARLERLAEEARRASGANQLPNVFHYATERKLFEAGKRSRGLEEAVEVLTQRLSAVERRIEDRRAALRRMAGYGIGGLVGLISLLGLQEFIWVATREFGVYHLRWHTFLATTVVFGVVSTVLVVLTDRLER